MSLPDLGLACMGLPNLGRVHMGLPDLGLAYMGLPHLGRVHMRPPHLGLARWALLIWALLTSGFALNERGRSPLSMAIETLPELARVLLDQKSRFEYRWWGNDLYWFSFTGIILPLQGNTPLQVRDRCEIGAR